MAVAVASLTEQIGMRLPRRPLDPALKDAVPSSPSSNRVHPEVSPHAGSPAVVTPKPRRLPPLSGSPGAALTPERGPGPEPRSNLEPGSHRADTALSPGAASELKQRRIRGHVYEELRGAFQLFDLDGDGALPVNARCEHRTTARRQANANLYGF